MNRTAKRCVVGLLVGLATGCIPEKRIVWSPDGKVAAVHSDDGLFFIDGEGAVLKPRLPKGGHCAWFSDSRRLAVVHSLKVKSWDEVADLYQGEALEQLKNKAELAKARMLAYQDDWDKFEFDPAKTMTMGEQIAIILYIRDRLPEGLPEKMGEKWQDALKLEPDASVLQVFTFSPDQLLPGQVLVRSLESMSFPAVSKNDKLVAVLTSPGVGDGNASSLHVISADGGNLRLVAEGVASGYDWSPDGRSLAYVHSMASPREAQDDVQLGSLATITVAGPDDTLLKEWIDRADRAGLLFNERLSVRWLSDGRLFFTSAEVTLPATTADMPGQWSLFALDPRMPASVIRVISREVSETLEPSLPMFELSPDEKRLLLPGPEGEVWLYNIASGGSKLVTSDRDPEKGMRSLPSWRDNNEFCVVSPVKGEGTAEMTVQILLCQDGGTKVLSEKWPDEIKTGWLLKQAASQPAQ